MKRHEKKTPVTEEEIKAAQQKLDDLKEKQKLLTLTAPFDGTVLSLNPDIRPGLAVAKTTPLFNLVQSGHLSVFGYADETDISRIRTDQPALFRPDYSLTGGLKLTVTRVDPVNATTLTWPELSSLYRGPLQSDWDHETHLIKPRGSLALVTFESMPDSHNSLPLVTRGHVKITALSASPLLNTFKKAASFIIREIGLN